MSERVHFVGIGGIHMSGLAHILVQDGIAVSGCDRTDSPLLEALRAEGARIAIGHGRDHVRDADWLVRTVAVPEDHPEIVAAREAGLAVLSRAELVARIAAGRPTLTVAGSHGKTTTSTMATVILRRAGFDPGFVLGGEVPDLPSHAERGGGDWIVLEADEYGRAFHHYSPAVAVINNLERDHLDYYGSDEALREAFVDYARTLTPGATLIVGVESPAAAAVAETIVRERPDLDIQGFALEGATEWGISGLQEDAAGTRFAVRQGNVTLGELELSLPGLHNVRNALAATAAATAAGADFDFAIAALREFRGVARRFQPRGAARGALVLDDYAHHPTKIRATVEAARARFPERRLVVLFQPHTYSRSHYLLEEFRTCFQGVDRLFLCETYAAREPASAGIDAATLAAEIHDPEATYAGTLAEAPELVAREAQPGDVIITMGAGDVTETGPAILRLLGEPVGGAV